MASLNRKQNTAQEFTHEGAKADSHITALQKLERSVMSCLLWEDEFYEDGESIAERIKALVAICKLEDVAKLAIKAKQDMRLRHVPLLLARELLRTKEGRKQMINVIPEVITRVDDTTEILAMYLSEKKVVRTPAKLPNQLKKYLGESFNRFDEYQFSKYNRTGKAVSLKDAVRLVHPVAKSVEQNDIYKRLLKDELQTPDTWEVEISKSTNKLESWSRLLSENKLGGLAMLRNVRNMVQAGVDNKAIWNGINEINAGRLLPINFISAAKFNPQFEPVIEKKFLECFTNREKVSGDTVLLIDVSGSMDDRLSGKSELTRLDVACSLAMIAAETFANLRVFTFSNALVEVPVRHGFALRDIVLQSQPHDGTNLGAAINEMPQDVRLIVLTDEQSADRVQQRKGYMVNVASSKNGVGYKQWTHVDGWSDKIIDYIIKSEK